MELVPTSEMGHSRHFDGLPMTSGLHPEADIVTADRHVSNAPTADLLAATSVGSCAARPLALKLLRLSKFLSGNACRGAGGPGGGSS
jgi:hypothetical protein